MADGQGRRGCRRLSDHRASDAPVGAVVMAGLAYNCLNANASNSHVCNRVLGLVPSHALGVDKGHLMPDTSWPERKDGGESESNCGGGSRDTGGESGEVGIAPRIT